MHKIQYALLDKYIDMEHKDSVRFFTIVELTESEVHVYYTDGRIINHEYIQFNKFVKMGTLVKWNGI